MEKHILKMKTTRSIKRSFVLSASALGCLLLTACGSVYGPQSKTYFDLDKLLQSAPSGAGSLTAGNGNVLRGATRQDPKSGLSVDISPITLTPLAQVAPLTASAASAAPTASARTRAGPYCKPMGRSSLPSASVRYRVASISTSAGRTR